MEHDNLGLFERVSCWVDNFPWSIRASIFGEHVPSKRTMALKAVNVYDKNMRNRLLKQLDPRSTHVSPYLIMFYVASYDGCGALRINLLYTDDECLSMFVKKVEEISERVIHMIALDYVPGLRFLHR